MLKKDVGGLEGKIPSADACIKWGEFWYSAPGVIFRKEEAFCSSEILCQAGARLLLKYWFPLSEGVWVTVCCEARDLRLPFLSAALPVQGGFQMAWSQAFWFPRADIGKQVSNQNKTKAEGTGSSSSYAVILYWTLASRDSFACQIFALQGLFTWKPTQIFRETCVTYSMCFLLYDFLYNWDSSFPSYA